VKRVLTAVVLIPLVILALFKAPLWLFTLLVFGVAVLAAHEYLSMVRAQGFRPFHTVSYIALAVSFAIIYLISYLVTQLVSFAPPDGETVGVDVGVFGMTAFWSIAVIPTVVLLIPLVLLLISMRREPLSNALPDAAVSYMMLPYVGLALGLFPILRSARNGSLFLLYLMLLVWCGDVAAYYVGRAFGRYKLAPPISPGKTWEGTVASLAAAIAVGVALFHYINPIASALRGAHLLAAISYTYPHMTANVHPIFRLAPVWLVALFAAAVNGAAQLGDLVESGLKRGAGLKDSGTLLPGHGGVLDRIDALLFALPVGFIFYVAGLGRYFASGVSGSVAVVAH
jgi:phosphatidate cytidylyltransferase